MSSDARPDPDVAQRAIAELARVQRKVDAARTTLSRLLQELAVAENLLSASRAAHLLEANEQLVLAGLRHQAEAENVALTLARLAQSAGLDALTQLPNRMRLLDRFAQVIAQARRHEGRLALLFLDLNDFKHINDSLGHAAGDEVLKLVAERLLSAVRDGDIVSRHGGDEFVILLIDIAHSEDAARIANKLATALEAPARIGDQELHLTASIGISLYPDDGDDVPTLVACADAAMYRAKRHGSGSHAFHGESALPLGPQAAPPDGAQRASAVRHLDLALADQRRRHAELQQANEQLVLAALGAQELQAAAERAQRRQAEFLGRVADQFAHPLAPIRQAAALLAQISPAGPLLPQARSIIDAQAANIARLVEAVREVSQAEAFALSIGRATVDLRAVAEAAIAASRAALDARRQHFTAHLPDDGVPVAGDAARLEQVIRNLLDNASQYTPEGGRIELALSVLGNDVELAVSDSGIGIRANALPGLFTPFAQGLPALGIRGLGLGIGLTVVRALVEAQGGHVRAHSDGAGRGSRFVVTLPLARGAAAAAGPAA